MTARSSHTERPAASRVPPRARGSAAARRSSAAGTTRAFPATLTQVVDVSGDAGNIDAGRAHVHLSGELGGYLNDIDAASVAATPRSAAGGDLAGGVSLGPVTTGDRLHFTGFEHRSADAGLPAGTRSVRVVLTLTGGSGGYRDAYADNIGLSLNNDPVPPPCGCGGGGGPLPDKIAPTFSASPKASPSKFAVDTKGTAETAVKAKTAPKKGTTFSFKLSEPGRVVFAIDKAGSGRKVGKKCVKQTRKNKKKKACKLYKRFGAFAVTAKAGANSHKFSGRIGKKKLGVGTYRVTVTATDAAGNKSKPKTLTIKVVR